MQATQTEMKTELKNDLKTELKKSDQIRLFDSLDGLELYCYTTCDDSSSDLVKSCRGMIFKGDDLVVQTFGYTPEYVPRSEILRDIFRYNVVSGESCIDTFRFYESHEGALLRVYYLDGRWRLSTHHKLDAFQSRWGSAASFGELFQEALRNAIPSLTHSQKGNVFEQFTATLDPTKQYAFLLCNTDDNRIVCLSPPKASVFHVGTFTNEKVDFDHNIGIPHPVAHAFESFDKLVEYVMEMDIRHLQGLIVFSKNSDEAFKIFHPDYLHYAKVRGNQSSIKFRYLEIRNNPDDVHDLVTLYPEHKEIFQQYEDILQHVTQDIKDSYIRRYIHREEVTLPQDEYAIMRACHEWHIADRTHNRISYNKVSEIMAAQTAPRLNRIIRRVLNDNIPERKSLLRPVEEENKPVRRFGERNENERGRGENRGRGGRGRGRGRGDQRKRGESDGTRENK